MLSEEKKAKFAANSVTCVVRVGKDDFKAAIKLSSKAFVVSVGMNVAVSSQNNCSDI